MEELVVSYIRCACANVQAIEEGHSRKANSEYNHAKKIEKKVRENGSVAEFVEAVLSSSKELGAQYWIASYSFENGYEVDRAKAIMKEIAAQREFPLLAFSASTWLQVHNYFPPRS
ncbi:MAG: hypothetical protein IJ217_04745 [Clostridia bacterium]|nr:hypothetical protein [Clostridia bacterium]